MAKIKTGYVNRDGARIGREDWDRLIKDEDYREILAFDDGIVRVSVEWIGQVINIGDTWPDMWKVFKLNVGNYNELGDLRPDPVENGKFFPTQDKAKLAYEAFLERWTACHSDEDGEFVEEGNILTPPPPPSLDKAETDISAIKGIGAEDGVGAW